MNERNDKDRIAQQLREIAAGADGECWGPWEDVSEILLEAAALLTAPETPFVEKAEWLVWSNEHRAWWAANRCGYRIDVQDAGRYTLAEARSICRVRCWEDGIPPETMMHEKEATRG